MLRLDVRALERRGYLRPGMYFSWQWSRDGEPCGNIGVQVANDHVRLIYTRTPYDSDPQSFDYPVWIERTLCHYGNSRPWFRCPWCGRRCAILYGISGDGYFGCRLCLRLAYTSEAEDNLSRLWRKQRKLEARLGEDSERPKGMRQRTYARICVKLDAIEEAKDRDFMIGALAFLRRTGMTLDELLK